MYIHANYKLINSNKDIKEYKKELKELSKINLRRSSKFNILAVLGALRATKDLDLSENLGIYVASEYGPINDVYKIMDTVSDDEHIVMPFDFLNINSNNVSFYVSQALDAKGKNTLITSRYLSFEKALQLASFDLELDEAKDALIGGVDESLSSIKNYENYLEFAQECESKDGSCWLYVNKEQTNSLAEIKSINELNCKKDLEEFISKPYTNIALNQFALNDEKILSLIDESRLINKNEFYGSEGALHLLNLCENKGNHLYIAKDNKENLIVIELKV